MFSFGFFLPPFFYVQNVWERMGSIALDFFGEKKKSSGKNFLKSITDTMCHVCFSAMLYHLHRDSETLEKFLSGCITLRTSGNISLVSAEAPVLHTRTFLYVHLLAQLAVTEFQAH